jgi:hypothetical protein
VWVLIELITRGSNHLTAAQKHALFTAASQLVRLYATAIGQVAGATAAAEKAERFEQLLRMLKAVAESAMFEAVDPSCPTQPSTVVLHGVQTLPALITPELLQIPDVCEGYFDLLLYVFRMESWAGQLYTVPPTLCTMLRTVERGLLDYGTDPARRCLDILLFVAAVHLKHLHAKTAQPSVAETLAKILDTLFQMLLLQPFPASLRGRGSDALFSLVCCNAERFKAAAGQLVARQPDPTIQTRLTQAFATLMATPGLQLSLDRTHKKTFKTAFLAFLGEVRGFLVVK